MVALDTNLLVRVFLEDKEQPEQTQIARRLVSKTEPLYVSQIVQVEAVWVLDTVYQCSKSDIVLMLEQLAENTPFVLQRAEVFAAALDLYRKHNVDFADCLILAESREMNTELFTFDKRLAKLSGARQVSYSGEH